MPMKFLLSLYFPIEIFTCSVFFYWGLYPHVPLHQICTSPTLRKAIMPSFPQRNYAPHVCLRHICTSITLQKAIMPCFPQRNYAHKNFKEKLCPACHAARRRKRAEAAPHTASHTTSFRNPVSHTSLLSNLHIAPRLPRKLPPLDWATSWLSYSIVSYLLITLPLDWASQLWATSWLPYHWTELVNCEPPLNYYTTELSNCS